MNLRCLFGHKWEIIQYFNFIDTSYGDRAPSFILTLRCEKCGNVKEKTIYGGGRFDPNQLK